MEREGLRVKHDISNDLHQLQFISIVDLTLTVSNNCACNATRHEGVWRSSFRIKEENRWEISALE